MKPPTRLPVVIQTPARLPPGYEATARRRVQLLAAEAVVLVTAGFTLATISRRLESWVGWPVAVLLWGWVACTSAFCLCSPESWAFRRELKGREPLSSDEFYTRFYRGSGIPKDVVKRVRRSLLGFEWLADRLAPADYLPWLDDDLDMADVLYRLGREFGVKFTKADYPAVDGTLDNLVRLVHARLARG
jgi:hypothetical protein